MFDELIASLVRVRLRTLSIMTFSGHARGPRFQLHARHVAFFVNRPPVLVNLAALQWDVSVANPAGRTVELVLSRVGLRSSCVSENQAKAMGSGCWQAHRISTRNR